MERRIRIPSNLLNMSIWSILEVVSDCCNLLEHWRFFTCVLIAAAVAVGVYAVIGLDPWRWVAVIPIMLAGLWLGGHWEHSGQR